MMRLFLCLMAAHLSFLDPAEQKSLKIIVLQAKLIYFCSFIFLLKKVFDIADNYIWDLLSYL